MTVVSSAGFPCRDLSEAEELWLPSWSASSASPWREGVRERATTICYCFDPRSTAPPNGRGWSWLRRHQRPELTIAFHPLFIPQLNSQNTPTMQTTANFIQDKVLGGPLETAAVPECAYTRLGHAGGWANKAP